MLVPKQVLIHHPNDPREKKGLWVSISERRETFNLGDKGSAYGSKGDLGVYIKSAFGLLAAFFKFF